MRISKPRAEHRTGKACQLRWIAYDESQGKGAAVEEGRRAGKDCDFNDPEPWIWPGSPYASSPYSASETAGDHRVESPRALEPSELDARRV